jgi:hypothetical protein
MMMTMVPNNASNVGSSDHPLKLTGHAALPVMSYPHLYKKRFHREKKNNLKLKMQRSLSAPLNGFVNATATQKVLPSSSSSSTAAVPPAEEPLSSDRWGSSAETRTSLASLARAPTRPSRRPGFENVQKDSQFQLPRRQRSFQDTQEEGTAGSACDCDCDCDDSSSSHLQHQSLPPQLHVRRTKSNVEAVGRIIDQALVELQHHQLQQQ